MSLPSKPPATPVSLTKNARIVLEKRYLVKDSSGAPVERPEQLFWRVATVVAGADHDLARGGPLAAGCSWWSIGA